MIIRRFGPFEIKNHRKMHIIFSKIFMFLLVVRSCYAASIIDQSEVSIQEGSGLDSELEECRNNFVGYFDKFLRGAKESVFITYNNTSLDDCKKHCCERASTCHSFSYLSSLRVCYVMNVSMLATVASLDPVKGWSHYHRISPTEPSTSTSRTETLQFQSTTDAYNSLSTTSGEKQETITTTSFVFLFSSKKTTSSLIATSTVTSRIASPTNASLITPATNDVTTGSNLTVPSTFAFLLALNKTKTLSVTSSPMTSLNMSTINDATKASNLTVASTKLGKLEEIYSVLSDATTVSVIKRILGPIPRESRRNTTSLTGLATRPVGASGDYIECTKTCENKGVCRFSSGNSDQTSMECICQEGFSGDLCQDDDKALGTAGFPTYLIVVACLGFLLFILFVVLLILYLIYRKKTGKYRVKKQREKWSKRNRQMQGQRKHHYESMDPITLVGSELSVPGSVNSTATRTTSTLA